MHLAAFAFMVIAGTGGICNKSAVGLEFLVHDLLFNNKCFRLSDIPFFLHGFDTRTSWKVQP